MKAKTIRQKVSRAILDLGKMRNSYAPNIIELLSDRSEMNGTELMIATRAEQPEISTACAGLLKLGVITGRREGKYVYFSLQRDRLHELMGVVALITEQQAVEA